MKCARVVFAVMCFSVMFAVLAQPKIHPDTYGTTSLTYISLAPWDFRPYDSSVQYGIGSMPQGIYRTNPDAFGGTKLVAPLHLPEGAIISYLEMTSCNADAMEVVSTSLVEVANPASSSIPGPSLPASSCGVTSTNISPVTVDNTTTAYGIQLDFASTSPAGRVVNYRVGYKLQVSPAPATATFSDVPVGSNLHRFVEALVASGITAGCGGGKYCPDNPVTRGQMAVFLSVALGLHFAP